MSELNFRCYIEITGLAEKKTKAEMFKDVQVGDIISMVISLQRTTSSRGNYATYVNCLNKRTDALTIKSQSEVFGILNKYFSYKQVNL
ncbi:hypothetical protein HOU35_gp086 [Acinetobacter phage vB_AbaM_B09_Aci05]|uniref:Uncharacterized protein n=2 Tax=Saclayvirus TaxID=2733128 RepID=A0A386KJH6_9CAUD|nr:hypothetical protein HOU30_gp097 [Acinetobacter phage vB_AbaM_B09_Aci02-2]YP_009813945.1 hypothetical protein HOU35_gp086 [Acinetobacter phage vB_AbaM_B09_Aci05]AYD82422.1 hypothetical protein Aci05_091 [Acinetobacter phage vB_AbaM_B09_Aci05]AYD85798.1 hypothetical protein Aci022_093 [Acinetobacter phage vB_AbaM_B09_Aci02-2]QQV88791.1 hypothetical protein Liucustia_91 [Acinetobacter phage Liucustia]